MMFLFNWMIFKFHVNFEGCQGFSPPPEHLMFLQFLLKDVFRRRQKGLAFCMWKVFEKSSCFSGGAGKLENGDVEPCNMK